MRRTRSARQGLQRWVVLVGCLAAFCASRAVAQSPARLGDLSLEELMAIEVTSAGKKEQRWSHVPAALSVLTADDIRRSGATSVPELLRTVPGLEVARINAHAWAITIRGFNALSANKLLVLIDGRSVYTPLFSGVWWDVQDLVLEDIERIEIIRGPGGAIWGANAVNGVINIVTKRSQMTQGALASLRVGTEERAGATLRYGGIVGTGLAYRAYGKYVERDEFAPRTDDAANDAWRQVRAGFRMDWDGAGGHDVTLQGDLYDGKEDDRYTAADATTWTNRRFTGQTEVSGGNLLARWTQHYSERSEAALQLYYDRTTLDALVFNERRDTLDVDFTHHLQWGRRHDVVWGVGYRVTTDRIDNTFAVSFLPAHRTDALVSGFIQDEWVWVPDRLSLTVGSKLERNAYSGFEIQPSVRALWTPTERQSWWAAVSRAVKTPTRVEQDIRINIVSDPTTLISAFGDRDVFSEEVVAYEAGGRVQVDERLTVIVAGFYNVYDHLISARFGTPFAESDPPPPHTVVPLAVANGLNATTYGVETATRWQAAEAWRLTARYALLRMRLRSDPGMNASEAAEGRSPHHQASLQSSMDLGPRVTFEGLLRYVGPLPNLQVDGYVEMDLRLTWRATRALEWSVAGQNLLHSSHAEFADSGSSVLKTPTRVQRGVYTTLTWRWDA